MLVFALSARVDCECLFLIAGGICETYYEQLFVKKLSSYSKRELPIAKTMNLTKT